MIARTLLGLCLALTAAAQAQTLTKLYDFSATVPSPMGPYDTPSYINNELWFTTQNGGTYGFGSIARYNFTNDAVTTVFGDMETSTGNTPQSSLTQVGNLLFYTTTRGGLGDKGTLNMWDMSTSMNHVLHAFPQDNANSPVTPQGNVTVVPRAGGLYDLYYNTQGGGAGGSAGGTVSKATFDPTTKTLTNDPSVLYNFISGSLSGRQPFEGMTRVGDTLYLTTFAGGPTSSAPNTNAPNGGGWLFKVNLNDDSVSPVVAMPTTDASTVFPAHNPTFDSVTNALYFTTTGTTTRLGDGTTGSPTYAEPGSVMKYDLGTETLSMLGELPRNLSSGSHPEGRFPYGPISIYEGFGYFTTIQGGANNGGTINRISLASGQITKLFDLDSSTGDNFGGEARGGFLMVPDDEIGMHFYLTPRQGGAFDKGTILDLYVVPEPSSAMLALAGVTGLLARRRRSISLR